MDALKLILDSLQTKHCDWVALRKVEELNHHLSARNGSFSNSSTSMCQGIMVEVLCDDQIAYMGTNDVTPQGVQRAFDRAVFLAKASSQYKVATFDQTVRSVEEGRYKGPFKESLQSISLPQVMDTLVDATKVLKNHDEIKEANAWSIITSSSSSYICSSGTRIEQETQLVTRDISATAELAGEVQRRSLGMPGGQWGLEAMDAHYLLGQAERIREEARELVRAENCPVGQKDIIIAPDQLYLQVHESIGHPLELDRILGDERNYAGWSFVGLEDFGNLRYGPDILNVTFDPHLEGEMASYAFDDNGTRAEKEYLIRNGILTRAIGGSESQFRSGVPGVSCARASSWNRPPTDRMANINIEPGESSLDDMISSIEEGIIMRTNRSWSIDDYRNKFQFGCEYGELVKNGKVVGLVKNPNYRGSTINFWSSLDMVGNRDTFEVWGSPYCGKAEPNQVIRVGHAIPYCKFKSIDVFGGA